MNTVARKDHHSSNFFERLGLAMLLATRSDLIVSYSKEGSVVSGELSAEMHERISALSLTDSVQRELTIFLLNPENVKQAHAGKFLDAAARFTSMYSGDPCPRDEDSAALVEAFHELDENTR